MTTPFAVSYTHLVDAGTSLVEAELESNISTDHTSEKGMSQTEGEDAGSETTEAGSSSTESTFTSESILSAEQSTNENGTVNTSASVQEAPKLSFSEDTLKMCIRDRSQTARDKLGSQKGKSPDLQLRSQSVR